MKILVLVATIPGENPGRRKGKGFLAMLVNQELVDPKAMRKGDGQKGKALTFVYLANTRGNASQSLTLGDRPGRDTRLNRNKAAESCNEEKLFKSGNGLSPRVLEKGIG